MNAQPTYLLGVDVGGTKIAAAVVTFEGQILGQVRTPTEPHDQDRVVANVLRAMREVIAQAGLQIPQIAAIGLGAPGDVDPERGVAIRAVNIRWDNLPFVHIVQDDFKVPAFIENDVRAATLGELYFGAGREHRNLVYLSVGTGIANGVVIDGRLYRGVHGMAGEIGHAVFDRRGPRCACGIRGCLEAMAAGPAMAHRAGEWINAGRPSTLMQMAGNDVANITGKMVLDAAARGDPVATDAVEEAAAYLAIAILMLHRLYDPEIVVLGGGIAQAGEVILAPIRQVLERELLSSILTCEHVLRLSELGSDTGILGAVAIAIQGLREKGKEN